MQSRSFSLLASVSLIALSTLTGCSSMPGWMGGDAPAGHTPSSMEALLNKSYKEAIGRAESAYKDGKKDDAVDLYMKASQYAPQEVYPLLQMSDILWEMHNTPEVIAVLEHARVVAPDNVDVLRNLGRAYVSAGNLKKAQDTYTAALTITPSDVRILNGLGLAYDLDGNHDAAQKHYRTGLELEPSFADLQNNLAFSLISSGKFDEAAKILEPLVNSANATARQRQNLALAYGMLGREDDVARVASADLSPAEIKRNLLVYAHLRNENEHGKILNSYGKPSFNNGSLSNKPAKPLPKHVGDDLKSDEKVPAKVTAPKAETPAVEAPVVLTDINSADVKPTDTAKKETGVKLEEAKPVDTVKAPEGEKPLASASISPPQNVSAPKALGMEPIISGPTAKGDRKAKAQKDVATLDNGTQVLTTKIDGVVKAPTKGDVKIEPTTSQAPQPAKAAALIDGTKATASAKKPVAKLVDGKIIDTPRVAPIEAKAAAEKAKKDAAKKAAEAKKAATEAAKTTHAAKPVLTPPATEKTLAKASDTSKDALPVVTPPALGTGKVFLGTFATESEARIAWIRVWSAHSSALGTMVASIEPKDGKQSLYAVGAANKDDAAKICAQLKDAGVDCSAN